MPCGAGVAWRSNSGCSVKYLATMCRISPTVTPAPCVVPALAVGGVMDKAVSATRPASRAATDFERIFSGNVIAVLYIVSFLRRLHWLLRQTKNWSRRRFCQNRMILMEHWNSLDITYGTRS